MNVTPDWQKTSDPLLVGVLPYVRIVPTGIARDKQGAPRALKATLLITPIASPGTGNGAPILNLACWPRSFHQWILDGVRPHVTITFVEPHDGISLPTPCSVVAGEPIAIELPKVKSLTKEQTITLTRLWQQTIFRETEANTQGNWARLAATVALSVGQGATRPGKIADENAGNGADFSEENFGEDGQLEASQQNNMPGQNNEPKTIDSVVQVPHADLALALEFQQAAELCASLRQACGDSVDRRNLQKNQVLAYRHEVIIQDLEQRPDENDADFAIMLVAGRPLRSKEETQEAYIGRLNERAKWNTAKPASPHDRLLAVLAEAETKGLQQHIRHQRLGHYKYLQEALGPQRDQARNAYNRAVTSVTAGASACVTSPEGLTWSSLKLADAADQEKREKHIRESLEAHAITTWPQYSKTGRAEPETDTDRDALRAFFTIQTTPSLARAFMLTLDVEIDLKIIPKGKKAYGFLSAQLIAKDGAPLTPVVPGYAIPWTLTKFLERKGGWHFWPTTAAEFAQYRPPTDGIPTEICANSVSQFDGVLVMSRGHSCDPGSNNSRYDITSMDIRSVAELEMQRRLSRGAAADDELQTDFADLAYGGNRQTTGLTLMCRSAQDDAVARLAMRLKKSESADQGGCIKNGHVMLDAEDLTIGFRLAVGVPMTGDNGWTTEWRPLTARQIEFGTSGHKDRRIIETVLGKLVGVHTSRERIALDSAFHTVPARLLPTANGKVEASVEQAVCVWDGGPMGVDCSSPDETTGYVRDSLGFGRTLSVPTASSVTLPRLRYGHPYRFAMMAVYSGGASLDLDDLERQKHTDSAAAQRFYPPDSCKETNDDRRVEPYVRALRQTKLSAPEVLLPGGHATRQRGPMGYEVARALVVRSVKSEKSEKLDKKYTRLAARATPSFAQRIIIAPGVSLSEASRHRDPVTGQPVLDSAQSSTAPQGGFPAIEQGRGNVRFPVVKTSVRTGIDGKRHVDGRIIVAGQSQATVGENEEVSDAVFRKGGSGRSSYYPDPAADRIAIGLRLVGSKDYIGTPMLFSLGEGRRYPDRLPIVVTLHQQQDARTKEVTDIRNIARSRQARLDPDRTGDITADLVGLKCHEIILTLAPNEEFALDIWCVPHAERLAREFSIIQSLTQFLAQSGQSDTTLDSVVAGACSQLPESLKSQLEKAIANTKSISYIGPGSEPVPNIASILAVAKAVEGCLCKSPLPELVGLQNLTLTHACNRAHQKPVIADLPPAPFEVAVGDSSALVDTTGLAPIRAFRPPASWRYHKQADGTPQYNPIPVAALGSTSVFLSGDVRLDLRQIDTIEVVATTALPTSALFDSHLRRRSVAMKRAGEWPKIPLTSAHPDQMPVPGDPDRVYKGAEDIFGFKVFSDGRVGHRQTDVVLLRAENLPRPSEAWGAEGKISLEQLFGMLLEQERVGAKPPVEGLRLLRPHNFTDGKARIMQVRVNALSRSVDMLRTADRVAKAGDAWLSGVGLFYEQGELVPAEHVLPEHQRNLSAPATVILPATRRPAKCDARAPVPVFQWKNTRGSATTLIRRRDSVVRIPLGREWFSSGQGERLGIVLWPPNLLLSDASDLDMNKVPLRGEIERIIDLHEFADTDLGAGGAFITRRGADPIEAGPPQTHIFMSRADFPDLLRPSDDPLGAIYVDDVEMPLADDGSDVGTAAPGETKGNGEEAPPPLRVALVTYEPRFDVEREEWYVDVRLRDGETASPFVRFGLVCYQPNTHRSLRCSRPVAQWVKPLPKRYISISLLPDQSGVVVTMTGRAATGRSWPAVVHPSEAGDASLPSMRVALFEDYVDDSGRPARRFQQFFTKGEDQNADAKILTPVNAAFEKSWKDGTVLVKPCKSGFGATKDYALWRTTIPLEGGGGQLRLHVEEVEHFLPASFAVEPVTEQFMRAEGRFVQGGPRLAATFDLTEILVQQNPKA